VISSQAVRLDCERTAFCFCFVLQVWLYSRKPMSEQRDWERFYDVDSAAHYWYNHSTNESRWDDYETAGAPHDDPAAQQHSLLSTTDTPTKKSHNQRTIGDKAKGRPAKKKKKPSRFASRDRDKDNGEDEDYDFHCHRRCSMLNVIVVEALSCFVEAVLRVLFLCLLLILLLVYHITTFRHSAGCSLTGLYKRLGRDLIVSTAAIGTLLIPCALLFVYRSYSVHDDWQLEGLPTVLGRVDPRRYGSITIFGTGADASNAMVPSHEMRASSLDGWTDSVVYYPRNFISDLREFVAGRRSLETIEVALSEDDIV
jgi:hypothetical protein